MASTDFELTQDRACARRADIFARRYPLFAFSLAIALMYATHVRAEDLSSQCSARLENFVKELDEILTENPPSVHPLLALLERTFPVRGCNVDDALKIVRTSKFFGVIDESPKEYGIWFGNPRNPVHRGYSISFGLLKDSGNSQLPSASVNK